MKVAIRWQETAMYKAEIELDTDEQAMSLVRKLETWGNVPLSLQDKMEKVDWAITQADWETEEA